MLGWHGRNVYVCTKAYCVSCGSELPLVSRLHSQVARYWGKESGEPRYDGWILRLRGWMLDGDGKWMYL